jgi:hypothetical protein
VLRNIPMNRDLKAHNSLMSGAVRSGTPSLGENLLQGDMV